ncbi:MAG: hypothetical protein E6R03_03910 [Hyphomicrobiaceae bacterium]|nr:MAG: hypothetical protein E6R03_03910 [Hyphomicrobiaceae bacterium]
MVAIHQGTASSVANPRIVFITVMTEMLEEATVPPGFLVDPAALEYRILDPSGTQVVAPTAVDLEDHRLRLGTFAPPITIGAMSSIGTWTIEWTWDLEIGDETYTYVQVTHFTVVDSDIPLVDGYAQVADARAEGAPVSFSDARIAQILTESSRTVEHFTRRFFDARYHVYDYDVRSRGVLIRTRQPIVAIEDILVNFSDFNSIHSLDAEDFRIYNRHMRGMLQPDDRDAPKVEVQREAGRWDFGSRMVASQQNATIKGWWGYTDPDGGPFGVTPPSIERVTMMLAFRNIRPLWRKFSNVEGPTTGAVQTQRTRDQSITYATVAGSGLTNVLSRAPMTGDPEIDIILMRFRAPPVIEAA